MKRKTGILWSEFLGSLSSKAAEILDFPLIGTDYPSPDLSPDNPILKQKDLSNRYVLGHYLNGLRDKYRVIALVGGYGEERVIYSGEQNKNGRKPVRYIHLGVDIWTDAGYEVKSPLPARVHSFADNAGNGNYGPTIVLEHEEEGVQFYSQYAHLSRASLMGMEIGDDIKAGEGIGWIGAFKENGDWPPHLHFQLILDMQEYMGNFPGVCPPGIKEDWLERCPDPGCLLRLKKSDH